MAGLPIKELIAAFAGSAAMGYAGEKVSQGLAEKKRQSDVMLELVKNAIEAGNAAFFENADQQKIMKKHGLEDMVPIAHSLAGENAKRQALGRLAQEAMKLDITTQGPQPSGAAGGVLPFSRWPMATQEAVAPQTGAVTQREVASVRGEKVNVLDIQSRTGVALADLAERTKAGAETRDIERARTRVMNLTAETDKYRARIQEATLGDDIGKAYGLNPRETRLTMDYFLRRTDTLPPELEKKLGKTPQDATMVKDLLAQAFKLQSDAAAKIDSVYVSLKGQKDKRVALESAETQSLLADANEMYRQSLQMQVQAGLITPEEASSRFMTYARVYNPDAGEITTPALVAPGKGAEGLPPDVNAIVEKYKKK